MADATVNIRMEKQKDKSGDGVQRGRVKVFVTDTSGSPLPKATITVSADNGPYKKTKSARDHGMAQIFENVPVTDLTVVSELTGYKTAKVSVGPNNFGGPDVTHGY